VELVVTVRILDAAVVVLEVVLEVYTLKSVSVLKSFVAVLRESSYSVYTLPLGESLIHILLFLF